MKKEILLSKAELRKVLGGSIRNGACSTSHCTFDFMGVQYEGQCGPTIIENGPSNWCTCSATGPFGDPIESDPMGICYVA